MQTLLWISELVCLALAFGMGAWMLVRPMMWTHALQLFVPERSESSLQRGVRAFGGFGMVWTVLLLIQFIDRMQHLP